MRFFLLTIFLISFASSSAQKPSRGSSAEKPWVEDRRGDYLLTTPGTKYPEEKVHYKTERIEYGKWRFDLSIKRQEYDLNDDEKYTLRNALFGSSGNRTGRAHRQIEIKGTDPAKRSFFASLDYENIIAEDYETRGLLGGEDDTRGAVLHKKLKGYIVNSRSDSSVFHLELYFDSSSQSANHIALFEMGTGDAIRLVPLFKHTVSKSGITGDEFAGIEFQKEGKTIAAARLGKDLVNDVVYRYWISDELDEYSKQTIAMVLTLVVRWI